MPTSEPGSGTPAFAGVTVLRMWRRVQKAALNNKRITTCGVDEYMPEPHPLFAIKKQITNSLSAVTPARRWSYEDRGTGRRVMIREPWYDSA